MWVFERCRRMLPLAGQDSGRGPNRDEDPATGRHYRDVALYVIRPARRALLPLELDGARDPASEVLETVHDLAERGYADAYRLFVEPVVGGAPPVRGLTLLEEEGQPLSL